MPVFFELSVLIRKIQNNLRVLSAFVVHAFSLTARSAQDAKITKEIYFFSWSKKTMDIEKTATAIVNSAIKVHKALGPGLLESVYQKCLTYELEKEGHHVQCEQSIPVEYETVKLEMGFRADMIVDHAVIIENKTVDKIAPIHEAQLLTYLKITGLHIGFLLNWNIPLMKDGIKRMINKRPI